MVFSNSLLSSTTSLTTWANQSSSQSSLSPRYSTWQCVCLRNQKRKPKLYLIPARHFLSTPIDSVSSSSITASRYATSGVSEVQRSTSSNNVTEMEEFEMELQELFNEVKSMVKIGKESDAMDLLRANYVAVKEELDSGLKGIEQAAVLDIIALGYMAVGDLKPVPALLDMINKIVDNLKDSEPLLDSVLMHVGSMYSVIGKFENAILVHQRAIRILENRYGKCNTLLVTPLLGMAKSFASDGKATKAIGVYERTLTILERNRGSESEDLVVPLFSLGKLLLKEGKAAEAEIPFTSIVNIYKKIYGERDGRVGMAMCSLANAKCSKGDANEAVDIYRNALRIIKDSNYMTIDNSILENMRIDLAELLHFVGRGDEGRELLEECLLINERFKGKNHPSMATHLINLAASYSRSKNYVEAERLLRTCLNIMEVSVGSEDLSSIISRRKKKMSSETSSLTKKMKKKKEGLGWIESIKGWSCVFHEFLFQRFMASHLQNPLPLPSLNHLTCIVTGSTSGIGRETARQLAEAGARVVMAVRNTKAAHELIQQWQKEWSGKGIPLNLEAMELDLLSLDSVVGFCNLWNARLSPLHVLINNAGIFSMGEEQKFSKDGYEQHMQVNHLAPALLSLLLLPSLIRGSPSRIINVNSVVSIIVAETASCIVFHIVLQ